MRLSTQHASSTVFCEGILLWSQFFSRMLRGCELGFIGLYEEMKLEASPISMKYIPEIQFWDLFAELLVDKLSIIPKGNTSSGLLCTSHVLQTQRNHIHEEMAVQRSPFEHYSCSNFS